MGTVGGHPVCTMGAMESGLRGRDQAPLACTRGQGVGQFAARHPALSIR
jgi:hypothetical protein